MTDRTTLTKEQLDVAYDALIELRRAFPQAISRLDLHKRRPLKIGIHHDIRDLLPGIAPAVIVIALRLYTGHAVYLRSLVEGAARIDLTGAEVGIVSAQDAASAKLRLEHALRRADARKAAKTATKEVAKVTQHRDRLSLSGLRAAARARAATSTPATAGGSDFIPAH